jgi:signal transduction histidine kinase
MTIRYILLRSYLLISLASASLLAAMIFVHFRDVLRVEIENKLRAQAVTVMQQIDTTLFERMENLVLWKQLDVMQELRFRDVDKRLSAFLSRLHTGYDGVYERLYVVDQNDQVVSASDASLIGTYQQKIKSWFDTIYKENVISLMPLNSPEDRLYFSIAIPSAFQDGELGRLYAGYDWQEVIKLLETAMPFSPMFKQPYAVLIDTKGQIIAKSSDFKSNTLDSYQAVKNRDFSAGGAGIFETASAGGQKNLVAYASSHGYRGFKGLGWRVLIIQPTKIALAPIRTLMKALTLFLLVTLLIATFASLWMAEKIALPIVRLAEFVRDFKEGRQQHPQRLRASREINELNFQFAKMIDNLETSRLDTVRIAKLAMIGEMAASMAHEVRTPLGILQSSAQMLQRETGLTEVGQEMIGYILSETKRLNDLVTTLLECSHPRPPRFVRQDIHAIIAYTVELVAAQADEKNIRVNSQFNTAKAELDCDRDQLIQVLLNLLLNAIQHTPEGGCVELRTFAARAGYVEIQISDDGKGVPDADKTRVFDPFFTQRKDGMGLGLTVVQQIIHAHHGKIFITDSLSGGACFHLVLPINNLQDVIYD